VDRILLSTYLPEPPAICASWARDWGWTGSRPDSSASAPANPTSTPSPSPAGDQILVARIIHRSELQQAIGTLE
jgi:hypothetical protein